MQGTLPYAEMAQWEGEQGVKIFFFLKNDAFVLPRETNSKDEERERKKLSSEHLLKKGSVFGEVELCG